MMTLVTSPLILGTTQEEPPETECGCNPSPTHGGEGALGGSFMCMDGTGFNWFDVQPFATGAHITAYVPWPQSGGEYSLKIFGVTDRDYCNGIPVYSQGGIGVWSNYASIPSGWNPTQLSMWLPPPAHRGFCLDFEIPSDDATGIRSITADGLATDVRVNRDPCDVDDEDRPFDLCSISATWMSPIPCPHPHRA